DSMSDSLLLVDSEDSTSSISVLGHLLSQPPEKWCLQLEPLFEHLYQRHVSLRNDLSCSHGGLKPPSPTEQQREGLDLATKRDVGRGGRDGRFEVGGVACHHHIPLIIERSCECKPIPDRRG